MLRLRTFGGLSIENSASRGAAANRRPLTLLALLAVSGSPGLSRDKVVALLWPESDAEHGRNSLSQVLSAIRRELAADDPVLGTAELRINTDVLACDVMEFEERIAANDFEAATRLYTGPLLDGVFLRNTPEFERWLDRERLRLEHVQADALERLATRASACADHVTAARLWRRRASLAPSDSRAALKLMESLVASGEPAGALAHYRVHQSVMREDVGIEPDASLAELVAGLRRGNRRQTVVHAAVAGQDPIAIDSRGDSDAEPTAAAQHHGSLDTPPGKRTGFGRIGPRGVRWIAGALAGALAGASLIGASLARRGASRTESPSRIERLAVLPLVNRTGDTAVSTVAEALTQELISSLLRAGVPVMGYYSVAKYRGSSIPLAEVGRALNVDAVATWVVSGQGSELRVALEVARPSSGEGLWASTRYA
ncbi:MAG TPA: BTAD domain-containing putative transcriptional regulator, partial [Gemmatimonadaceae bacterium]|nr:BTAD domain-containing putative transcriptional regulator [Gemmatimonadaceae bacterium]